ncbi:hypothetical protein Syun_019290 [Stephania yunnanensis]|uniref:Uncharacterized protein n=1 Tax=Stephania yunnanensis TaxID=152371 RepID=A0AAP0NWJ3_9MAGN
MQFILMRPDTLPTVTIELAGFWLMKQTLWSEQAQLDGIVLLRSSGGNLVRNGGSTAKAVAVLHGPLLRLDQSRNSSKQDKLKEIGVANRDLAESYVVIFNFKEASSHCAKALDINKAQ